MPSANGLLSLMREELPLVIVDYAVPPGETGLVIIDEVHGFCTVGAGNLAPPAPDAQVDRMVAETARLARRFAERRWPILAFLDTHEPGRLEPPYPPHCERGTGEENFVPELAWLEDDPDALLIRKDCINCFVAGMEPTYSGQHGTSHNRVVDWINAHRLASLVVTGICTDICVMEFVLTMLAVRNRGLVPTLRDVVAFEPATATYDLPSAVAAEAGLPASAVHPKQATHHIGLYLMGTRGAVLTRRLTGL